MRQILTALAAMAAMTFALAAGAEPPSAETALQERVMGEPDAPITVVEYFSLTCSHCADFHVETLPKLKSEYIDTGKVKLIYRDFPFDRLGLAAAVLARCAPPDRYVQFLDVLFKNQGQWTSAEDPMEALAKIGRLGGISQANFQACMQNQELVDGILKMRLHAHEELDVNSTPTFIVNGDKRIVGNEPYKAFDELLAKMVD